MRKYYGLARNGLLTSFDEFYHMPLAYIEVLYECMDDERKEIEDKTNK